MIVSNDFTQYLLTKKQHKNMRNQLAFTIVMILHGVISYLLQYASVFVINKELYDIIYILVDICYFNFITYHKKIFSVKL
jgi:hypothetical protein